MAKKTGVLLINLGTPDSPKTRDVRKYLTEFLNDPRVIDIPFLLRLMLVNLIIVPFRAPKSAKIYKELFDLNNGVSPLIFHGEALQQKLVEKFQGENVHFHLAMRYGKPSLDDVCAEMDKANYDEVIIFSLYPQYASASTGSSIEKAMRLIRKWYVIPDIKIISQFYDHPGYIDTVVAQARKYDISQYDHVLFSYHGLPVRQVDKVYEDRNCDNHSCEEEINDTNRFCYKATSYATTRLVAEKLGLKKEDYTVCFQSRLDKNWLEPFSDKVVEEWAKKGAKKLLVLSPAFVADCLETTIEISGEYLEIFQEHGGEQLDLVESLNTHPIWVDTCVDIIRKNM